MGMRTRSVSLSRPSGRYGFVEVKKVDHDLNANQLQDLQAVEKVLRVPVQLMEVHPR